MEVFVCVGTEIWFLLLDTPFHLFLYPDVDLACKYSMTVVTSIFLTGIILVYNTEAVGSTARLTAFYRLYTMPGGSSELPPIPSVSQSAG